MRKRHIPTADEGYALLRMLVRYRLTIAGHVRDELHRWEQRAAAIPDPKLRAQALAKLRDERLNAEAAAAFACLATRPHRASAARLMVAYEVMYDYLDAITEQPAVDPLLNGRTLHRALTDPFESTPQRDRAYYAHHSEKDDGGYLNELVSDCRARVRALPSWPDVKPIALRAATRCGEAQTRTHAVAALGQRQLAEWAERDAADGFAWWETAAGATASLCVHALFAAATDHRTATDTAERIDRAYQPAICALATLLDSLVDHDSDDPTTDHRYVSYYPTRDAASTRIATLARTGVSRARTLPHGALHAIVVAGIACFYASAPLAAGSFARPVADSIMDAVGPIASPISAVLRDLRSSRVYRSGTSLPPA